MSGKRKPSPELLPGEGSGGVREGGSDFLLALADDSEGGEFSMCRTSREGGEFSFPRTADRKGGEFSFPRTANAEGGEISMCRTSREGGDRDSGEEFCAEVEDVRSPGGCSIASTEEQPVYLRTPGFEHHAQKFLVSRPNNGERRFVKTVTTKKKKTVLYSSEEVDGNHSLARTKLRRDPVPMKFRALPQSFWQQPNHTNCLSPGAIYPVLPPLCNLDKDEEISGRNSSTNSSSQDDNPPPSRPEMISAANTDLLFSLFRGVEEDIRKGQAQGQPAVTVARRGRPKKHPSHLLTRVLKDDDPYLISAVTESLLPLIPDRSAGGSSKNCQGQQVLAMVSVREGDKMVSLPSLSLQHNNYSHILSELVVKL